MIIDNSLTKNQDTYKKILWDLFPIREKINFSGFMCTSSLGRTSKENYAIWQEWTIERLPLAKCEELANPIPLFQRYIDYFCSIEEQSLRLLDNSTTHNGLLWADLSSTVIQAFKAGTLEANDLGACNQMNQDIRTQKSICLINFFRKYLYPKILYSLVDKDDGVFGLRWVIKNHTKINYPQALTDNAIKCSFFSDLTARINEVQKKVDADRELSDKESVLSAKVTAIFLIIIFLYVLISGPNTNSHLKKGVWC